MLPGPALAVFSFLFGLVLGSFLNVVIIRIPAGKSIVLPSSACPKCGAAIRPYDNIPVFSYLILRGKCRRCRTHISAMYPLVEVLTGLLFLGCYLAFGLSLLTLKWMIFSALIVVLIFTDLRERILPDRINFTGFALGLILAIFIPVNDGSALWLANRLFQFPPPDWVLSICDALLGALVGSGILWIISEGYFRLRGREGMGLGDVKMMLMAGAFLGFKRTVLTILVGSILGSFIGVAIIVIKRKNSDYELPFGTFLGAAAILTVFFGTVLVTWYMSLLRIE
jgi:leader peptidase (prepilin peptidase) / N-methyltransferase